jgi:hypothetical protein
MLGYNRAQGCVGPAVLTSRQIYYGHDGGSSSSGTRGHRALIQEGPPLVFLAGVLPVCVRLWLLDYAAPTSPNSVLTLKSSVVVTGVMPHWSCATPSFKVKTECIPLCLPGSISTHKVTNSEINSITSVYYNISLI